MEICLLSGVLYGFTLHSAVNNQVPAPLVIPRVWFGLDQFKTSSTDSQTYPNICKPLCCGNLRKNLTESGFLLRFPVFWAFSSAGNATRTASFEVFWNICFQLKLGSAKVHESWLSILVFKLQNKFVLGSVWVLGRSSRQFLFLLSQFAHLFLLLRNHHISQWWYSTFENLFAEFSVLT